MEQYFKDVVADLSIEDMQLLGILYDQEATAGFKAIRNYEVIEKCGLSEATFRKSIYRLIANKFVVNVPNTRQQSLYLTPYGISAVKVNIEGVGV